MDKNKIMISINPRYVELILSGAKKYEFRKIETKRFKPDILVIYCTKPVSKIIGEVTVDEIIVDTPEKVWNLTSMSAGVSKLWFFHYFKCSKKTIAYKLGNVRSFNKPKDLREYGVSYPPQSFIYL